MRKQSNVPEKRTPTHRRSTRFTSGLLQTIGTLLLAGFVGILVHNFFMAGPDNQARLQDSLKGGGIIGGAIAQILERMNTANDGYTFLPPLSPHELKCYAIALSGIALLFVGRRLSMGGQRSLKTPVVTVATLLAGCSLMIARGLPGIQDTGERPAGNDPVSVLYKLIQLSREDSWQIDELPNLCTRKGVGSFVALQNCFIQTDNVRMLSADDNYAIINMLENHGIPLMQARVIKDPNDGRWKFHGFGD